MTRRIVIEEPCEHGQVIAHGVWSKEKEAAFLAGADPDDPKFDCPGGSRTVFDGIPEELVERAAKKLIEVLANYGVTFVPWDDLPFEEARDGLREQAQAMLQVLFEQDRIVDDWRQHRPLLVVEETPE